MRRRHSNLRMMAIAVTRHHVAACCFLILSSMLVSDALLPTFTRDVMLGRSHGMPQASSQSTTALHQFFSDNNGKQTPPLTNNNNNNIVNNNQASADFNNGSADLFKTLELKDEALQQAQTTVSILESALESAVSNMENMQQQLALRLVQMEQELETTKIGLSSTQSELEQTKIELQKTRKELRQSQQESSQLELVLAQSQEAASRVAELEEYVDALKDFEEESQSSPAANEAENINNNNSPWQLFSTSPKVIPMLNDWIAIKGTSEGEIQISGKVTNHPTIPDGDAIVTSPLTNPGREAEKKVVSTLSGSKYRLGTPMTMPSGESKSQKITSSKGKKSGQRLVKARSSITIPDLTGNTLGNGRYLLAGDAVSSINGRSWIQTAYRASPFGKPMGEALAIKYSPNNDAMKREFENYQKVSTGIKRGSFIKRIEFMPVAGNEMPDMSGLVMQRGVADVKAFMPKVGGRLEGELLLDCAITALRCVEALHSVRLVWNDLKTENFVVIEDQKGGVSFRGIDLESCMPVRTPPVDYTPEACPPEFAKSFLDGDAESFSLEYSYDVWSYGMFLYEVATGRGFFDGYSAEKITKALPTFQPDVDNVEDPVLADLISQCLSRNPKDRPSISQILKHPFLADVSSGKNPFDFLFGL